MKDINNIEFKILCENDGPRLAVVLIEDCLEQYLLDDDKKIDDTYANDRGVGEILTALWVARKELLKNKDIYDYNDSEDGFLKQFEVEKYVENELYYDVTHKEVLTVLKEIKKEFPHCSGNRLYISDEKKRICPIAEFSGNDDFLKQVITARKYLKLLIDDCGIRVGITGITSQTFKNDAGQWGEENNLESCICNMAGIVAMLMHPLVRFETSYADCDHQTFTNLPMLQLGDVSR